MNRVTIRRFDVIRTANIAAALYAVVVVVFALIFFVPFVLFAGVAGTQSSEMAGIMGAGVLGVLLAGLIGAVFYAIIGWIMTAIVVALYNVIAGRIGGIQAEVMIEGPGPGFGYPLQAGYPAQPVPYQGGQPPVPPTGWGPPQG